MAQSLHSFEWTRFEEPDDDAWLDIKDEIQPRVSSQLPTISSWLWWLYHSAISFVILGALVSSYWLWSQTPLDRPLPVAELEQLIVADATSMISGELKKAPAKLFAATAIPSTDSNVIGPVAETSLTSAPTINTPPTQWAQLNYDSIEQVGNRVLAEVVHAGGVHGGRKYAVRVYEFYQYGESGWKETVPSPIFWGPKETLDTTYLHVSYYGRDADAVTSAATRADRLYQSLYQTLGLKSSPRRMQFDVTMSRSDLPRRQISEQSTIEVPSPFVVAKPVDMTDAEHVYQLMANSLVDIAMIEAANSYALEESWRGLKSGLSVWLHWQTDGPVSETADELQSWLFSDAESPANVTLSNDYFTNCYHFMSVTHAQNALLNHCYGIVLYPARPSVSLQYNKLPIYMLVPDNNLGLSDNYVNKMQTVDLSWNSASYALFLDFISHRFGRRKLPTFLTDLDNHTSLESLIPAVFNISVAEFDIQWQEFRQQQLARDDLANH